MFASALANGGSLDNITPGVSYFKKLHSVGNFVPVTASAATMESGQTPIIVWWDYLLASEIGPSVKSLKIVIPSDASYAAYYDQAISKSAPRPATARLWEGRTPPPARASGCRGSPPDPGCPLVKDGTVDQAAYKALPPAPSGNVISRPRRSRPRRRRTSSRNGGPT